MANDVMSRSLELVEAMWNGETAASQNGHEYGS
jgi:hypothetical protein